MKLGQGSYSNTEIRDSIKIGNYTSIARECHFHEVGDNHLCAVNKKCVYTTNWDQPSEKEIEIGNDVWIGMGVKFLPGVKIGDGAIVGAWTVVAKDVPPFSLFVGNPGRVKRYRFTKEQIKRLQKVQWWNWSEEEVQKAKNEGHFDDIDLFLEIYD